MPLSSAMMGDSGVDVSCLNFSPMGSWMHTQKPSLPTPKLCQSPRLPVLQVGCPQAKYSGRGSPQGARTRRASLSKWGDLQMCNFGAGGKRGLSRTGRETQ